MLCEVCKTAPATRRGVVAHGSEPQWMLALTYGQFCDTCIAYPNSWASEKQTREMIAPLSYWIERLATPNSRSTKDGE